MVPTRASRLSGVPDSPVAEAGQHVPGPSSLAVVSELGCEWSPCLVFSGDHRDLPLTTHRVLEGVCAPLGGVSHELVEGGDMSSNDAYLVVAGGDAIPAMLPEIGA